MRKHHIGISMCKASNSHQWKLSWKTIWFNWAYHWNDFLSFVFMIFCERWNRHPLKKNSILFSFKIILIFDFATSNLLAANCNDWRGLSSISWTTSFFYFICYLLRSTSLWRKRFECIIQLVKWFNCISRSTSFSTDKFSLMTIFLKIPQNLDFFSFGQRNSVWYQNFDWIYSYIIIIMPSGISVCNLSYRIFRNTNT